VTADPAIDGTRIQHALDLVVRCLRENLRPGPTEGSAGWYHYLDDPRPGVTASAVGLFVLALTGRRLDQHDAVVRFLVNEQITSDDDRDGGWPVRTSEGTPIIEATAWVVRALRFSGGLPAVVGEALGRGTEWIARNQNSDHGWGSYRGEPSRVFHTALAVLALEDCGTHPTAVRNARRWLLQAGNSDEPAWGPTAGAAPTLLHTGFASLALAGSDSISTDRLREITDWMTDQLKPGIHVEHATTVEEYDIPLPGTGRQFQNSLPHFGGPVAVTALLRAGANPLNPKLFEAIEKIIESQTPAGHWVLPRSPTRPSIWAIWPFAAAIMATATALLPTPNSRIHLVFSGGGIVQADTGRQNLTRSALGRLVRNTATDWFRRRRVAILLYTIAAAVTGTAGTLLIIGRIGFTETMLALIVPVLLLVFQIGWDHRSGAGPQP
jgi:hypothetical protein